MLQLCEVQRIYLDEISPGKDNLGIEVVKLVIESDKQVAESAKQLIQQVRQQLTNATIQNNVIDLIETIVIYKLPQKTRQEIEVMLDLGDFKKD